jgi:hypothetical protein
MESSNPQMPPKARLKNKQADWLAYNRRADIILLPSGKKSAQYFPHGADDSGIIWQDAETATQEGSSSGLVQLCVGEGRAITTVAPALEKLAMHVDDVLRTRCLVQSIHILGAKKQPFAEGFFKPRQREVAGVCAGAFCKCGGAWSNIPKRVAGRDATRLVTQPLRNDSSATIRRHHDMWECRSLR